MIYRCTLAVALALAALLYGCDHRPARFQVLDAYLEYAHTPRLIDPSGYVQYLRTHRFPNGELDDLPPYGIILHDARVEERLRALAYPSEVVTRLAIGESDPTVLYVVRPLSHVPFVITAGLPGGGGISTQAAELGALGITAIVHVGLAGLLGPEIPHDVLVLSDGSYKDGAAFLLSERVYRRIDQIARPDAVLTAALERELVARGVRSTRAIGFTMPILYFQPAGLVAQLLDPTKFAEGVRPAFVEMEQGPFFQIGQRVGVRTASLVVGSDRYTMGKGGIKHEFIEQERLPLKLKALEVVLGAFERMGASGPPRENPTRTQRRALGFAECPPRPRPARHRSGP